MGHISYEQARVVSHAAARVFQPRSPITTTELFAGRWNELTAVADAAHQPGVHVVIYGERGVGKTSLSNVLRPTINVLDKNLGLQTERIIVRAVAESGDTFTGIWEKLFQEIAWKDDRPMIGLMPLKRSTQTMLDALGLSGKLTVDTVRRTLAHLPGAVFIVDEFDRTATQTSKQFTDLIKALSDFAMDCTVVLVGVAETVGKLVADHASINRSLIQIHLPRMKQEELAGILKNAEEKLAISFEKEASDMIVQLSQGLPHYTHLIGLHAVRTALMESYSTIVGKAESFAALKLAVKQAEQTTTEKYLRATHSAHKDALYRQVLLACAVTAAKSEDAFGYFNAASLITPLSTILKRPVQIATFNNHLIEFAQGDGRGHVLEREGESRSYRYRFNDPLLVPFIFMNASASEILSDDLILDLLQKPG